MAFEYSTGFATSEPQVEQEHEIALQLEHQSAIRFAQNEQTFTAIKVKLQDEHLLENEVALVKARFQEELHQETWMSPSDWEMLAVMFAHDEKTAKHCVRTVVLARQKLQECQVDGKKLLELVSDETRSIDSFYRACLFHDVGKCCLPHQLLNLPYTDQEIANRLHSFIATTEEGQKILERIESDIKVHYIGETEEDLKAFLAKSHPIRYAPAYLVLSEEETLSLIHRFPDLDFSQVTIMELIDLHEKESGRILREEGDPVASEIASSHHRKSNKISSRFLGLTATVEEFLSLVDMYEAFTSPDRVYRKKASKLQALAELTREVSRKNIDKVLAVSWITSEIKKIDTMSLFPDEKKYFEEILKFIEQK